MRDVFIFPIFHIAIPLLLFEIPQIKKKYDFNRISLVVGSLLADIVDKSLLFMGIGSGRGISHTLLFVLISFIIVHLAVRGKKSISIPFLIGLLFHLVLDLPEVPLFYPFIDYDFIYIDDPFGLWLYVLFNEPIVSISEGIGLVILIFIIIQNRLFNIKNIITYLKFNQYKQLGLNQVE
ncbi:MAG: metal-dependent hydrolase [Candidatus Lokiarchaeota archaeon]|nr:metal-dependent hydrolase [Candidatus Lokiarchaeota archaeon]